MLCIFSTSNKRIDRLAVTGLVLINRYIATLFLGETFRRGSAFGVSTAHAKASSPPLLL